MLKNLFKTAFRSLNKDRAMATMNVLGLAVGMACFILIGLFVKDELTFDRFHSKVDRIYRGMTLFESGFYMGMPDYLLTTLQERVPGVETVARIDPRQRAIMEFEGELVFEPENYQADPAIFDIFDFSLMYGNEDDALLTDQSIVISAYIMDKYFGGQNPIGQPLKMVGKDQTFLVTGVLNEIPDNSRFKFNFITKAPAPGFNTEQEKWNMSGISYFLTSEGTDLEKLQAEIDAMAKKMAFPYSDQSNFLIERFGDLHLKSDYSITSSGVAGDIKFLWIFSSIGIVLLVIACVNYINSVTARSLVRNKEIGVRKTLGATVTHIRVQFLIETGCITAVAALLSAGLVEAALPYLNPMAGKQLSMNYFSANSTLPFLLLMVPLVTLMAGLYPALFSSRFGAIDLFSKRAKTGKGYLRYSLIIFQFVITLTLIFCTQVIFKQVGALQDGELGINADNVIKPTIPYGTDLNVLASAFETVAGVESVTSAPFPSTSGTQLRVWFDRAGQPDSADLFYYRVMPNAPEVYDLKMLRGEAFNQAGEAHQSQLLISEQLAARLPFENPIGESIRVLSEDFNYESRTITGVYQSPNFNAKTEAPMSIMLTSETLYSLDVKIAAENQTATIEGIRKAYHEVVPDRPFSYDFLNTWILSRYRTEQNFSTLFKYFAGMAILIASIGLIGLSAFTVVQKYKEIGVRKVLGASVSGITFHLILRYLMLIALAMLVAVPLAYWLMNQWLADFAEPVGISVAVFLLGFGAALGLLFITVGYQTIKAARLNPVEVLKDE